MPTSPRIEPAATGAARVREEPRRLAPQREVQHGSSVPGKLHDLLMLPEPRLEGRLVDETGAVLRSIYTPGARWGDFSRYQLFSTSRSQLLVVASRLSRLDVHLDDFYAGTARDALAAEPGLDARLAEIFLGVSLCSNLSAGDWCVLLDADPSFIVLAAEYCIWVLAVSGADGSRDLHVLVNEQRLEPLRAHREVLLSPFDRAESSMDWAKYVDRFSAAPAG